MSLFFEDFEYDVVSQSESEEFSEKEPKYSVKNPEDMDEPNEDMDEPKEEDKRKEMTKIQELLSKMAILKKKFPEDPFWENLKTYFTSYLQGQQDTNDINKVQSLPYLLKDLLDDLYQEIPKIQSEEVSTQINEFIEHMSFYSFYSSTPILSPYHKDENKVDEPLNKQTVIIINLFVYIFLFFLFFKIFSTVLWILHI